jgi:hypothetical protein
VEARGNCLTECTKVGICLERLTGNTNTCQGCPSPDRNLKPGFPAYGARVLSTQPRRSDTVGEIWGQCQGGDFGGIVE